MRIPRQRSEDENDASPAKRLTTSSDLADTSITVPRARILQHADDEHAKAVRNLRMKILGEKSEELKKFSVELNKTMDAKEKEKEKELIQEAMKYRDIISREVS